MGKPAEGPFTLGIDIGGTKIKAAVLDASGQMCAEQLVTETPHPAAPAAVLAAIGALIPRLPRFDRISVGFPGVVRGRTVVTAPNLGTERWAGFSLVQALETAYRVPARMLNDAVVQGLGVVAGPGLECVITLGTGVGCALFRDRRHLLHLEFGQFKRGDINHDQYIGNAALTAIGAEAWNVRVQEVMKAVVALTCCDRLYVGGGNARKVLCQLPPEAVVVSNTAGLTGGIRLWDDQFDAPAA